MKDLITVKNLDVTFRKGGNLTHAVRQVSFQLREGEILGIIGESGSGKSTIARAITGLVAPTGGDIFFEGKNLRGADRRTQHWAHTRIQMVFQNAVGSFDPRRTIGQSIRETVCRLCSVSRSEVEETVGSLLTDVGLQTDYASKYPHEISGGECQRAAIARAMAVHPRILICDEATSALDVSAQARIVVLLLELCRKHGTSMIFISHDLPLVSTLTDRLLIMHDGVLEEEGETSSVIRNPASPYTKELLDAVL